MHICRLLVLGCGLFLWWRQRHNQQIFFDVNATNDFSSKKLIRKGPKGSLGKVYKGYLQDGTVVAVKRLKDRNAIGGEIQFQIEVEMISLSGHRISFGFMEAYCTCTSSVIQMIIHWDVKATNILLDDYYEAIVGDFGLANLLDHRDSHVTTVVRGTVGHIALEYLSTSQSSKKTDVFKLGTLLLELISGLRALEFGKTANQKKGAMLDWVSQ
ncbi:protein NSP-INTERACTING KINASE 2-like [Gossypium australe]|uniref:Protein NSP-INTERACTING KINASE 2-like n=1 Tax=Gossypium australe TaxID=47621 RepID=A0A5B6V0W8_9ROSI|nr:protein NSP-INTERACTING KINASE 2-like [Gossypium australe]